jgi:thioredoxin-like negative regulator of GroEL
LPPLLRQASIEASNDPRIIFHYAAVLKAMGNKEEAVKQLNAVVAFKAEFKEKTEAQQMLQELGKGS